VGRYDGQRLAVCAAIGIGTILPQDPIGTLIYARRRFTFLHEVSACLNVQHISFFLTSLILMAGQVTALVIMFTYAERFSAARSVRKIKSFQEYPLGQRQSVATMPVVLLSIVVSEGLFE
jgi:hypothetical protein